MPISHDRFIDCLSKAGLLSPAELTELAIRTTANPRLQDCSELAHELVRLGKLTKYQAAAIYQEKLDAIVLGNYVIIDKLGAGGMGQVFRARHRKMDRVVALKLLPKKALGSPEAVERFQREVKAAARLVHSHIVTALDADAGGGTHFLVMELIEGHDLSALIKKDGPLPVATAVGYLLQAARGLEHAHAEGVIHRDIKPSNLLVDKRGTVKILDMGLARFSDAPDSVNTADTDGANQLTQAGNIMGTVDYMAPEQAVDSRQADERADIYSLGCALCYLLTARPPFEGNTVMGRLVAHRDVPIPSLSKLRPDVPASLDALFQRMLAKRPADRPQTMTEVIAALEAIAAPQSAAAKTWRLPVMLAGGGVTVAALVALVTIALFHRGRDAAEPATASISSASPAVPRTVAVDPRMAATEPASEPPATTPATAQPGPTTPNLVASTNVSPAAVRPAAPAAPLIADGGMHDQPTTQNASNPVQAGAKPPAAAVATLVKQPQSPAAEPSSPSPPPATVKPPAVARVVIPQRPPPEANKPADTRQRIPSSAAQAEALKTIKSVFADEYAAAGLADGKLTLIRNLLKQADESGDDPAARYVLLCEARDQGVELVDTTLIDKTTAELGAAFQVEPFEMQAQIYEKLVPKARPLVGNKVLAETLLDLAGRSAAAEQFQPAEQFLKLAAKTAAKTRDGQLVRRVKARSEEMVEARHESDAVQQAKEKLAAAPDDAEAHLALGRYLCFARADWLAGLSHLAKGSDTTLKSLAQQCLAAPPGEASALAAVGDHWRDAAQSAKGREKSNFRSGARHWYTAAQRLGLSGLAKTKVDKRLEELGGPEGFQQVASSANPALGGNLAARSAAPLASAGPDQRSVTLWALGQAGKVRLLVADQLSAVIKSPDALPPGDLVVSELEIWNNKTITNDDLARLRPLERLRLLRLPGTNITDAGLNQLQAVAGLDYLDLSKTPITDAGLNALSFVPKLHTLYLNHTAITDQGLARLADFPALGSLHLADTRITPDEAPQRLQRLRLENLEVSGMTDIGAARLHLLPGLMYLTLPNSNLTNAGLTHLAQLPKLIIIELRDSKRITDAELDYLARLPKIMELRLQGTSVTDAGIARFRAARPGIKVSH